MTSRNVLKSLVVGNYCPDCGSGVNEDGTYRLPRNYPLHADCVTCKKRSDDVFQEMGRIAALSQEHAALNALLK